MLAPTRGRSRRAPGRRAARVGPPLAAALLAVLLAVLLAGCSDSSLALGGGHGAVRGDGSGAASAPPARPARRLASLAQPERPTGARLPSGRRVGIAPASTRRDGSLAVPDDVNRAGWWRGGSRLGDPFGSILVAAHVDSSTQGLGPYVELLTVRPGQRVRLTSRHLRQDFAIRSRRLVPRDSLARQHWMFAVTGPARLTLVTCAPPFDRAAGGYQNLAVVTAVPLGTARRTR